ncbi:hypothetical protein YC2023_017655 [Brassica napus]
MGSQSPDQELQKSRIAFAHVLESGKGGAVFGSSESSSCFSTHCCVRTREYGGVSMCMEQVISKKLRNKKLCNELVKNLYMASGAGGMNANRN